MTEFPVQLIPANFREALGAAAAVIAVVFLFLSLLPKQRDHALRGTGLGLVCTIVLFANNGWAYFAGVFIVATAVTQLTFLQNLAAILRGASKEYFKYHREFLPPAEVAAAVAEDVAATEAAGEAEPAPEGADAVPVVQQQLAPERRMSAGQFGILVEEFTFRFLERRYGKSIGRHVRFVSTQAAAEFDGVMHEADFDRVFEIKASRLSVFPQRFLVDSVRRLVPRLLEYQRITGRRAVLHVVVVGNFTPNFQRRLREYRQALDAESGGVEIQFETLTFDEIGVVFPN